MTSFWLGEFVAARAFLERCHGLNDPAHRAVYAIVTAEQPHARMSAYLAHTLTSLGYIDQGRARIDEALREARQHGHVYTLVYVLSWGALIESTIRLPHEAQRHANEAVALSTEHDFPAILARGIVSRGAALTALGQAQEGLALITKGLSMYRATGAVLLTPWMLTSLAEAHAGLGQPFEGLNCLVEAVQIIETTGERWDEAEVHQLRGDLLNATCDQATAEACFQKVIDVSRRQGAKLFELRAATSLARLWRDQGKRTEAHDLLAPVYGWFTEGFDTPVLKGAKALLDELSGYPIATAASA
jgi:predicted ATPase